MTPNIGKKGTLTIQGQDDRNAVMVDVHVHGDETERIMLDLLKANEAVIEDFGLTEEPALQVVE